MERDVMMALEAVCFGELFIILCGCLFHRTLRSRLTSLYTCTVVAMIISLGVDFMAWFADGRVFDRGWQVFFNLMSVIMSCPVVICFGFYASEIIRAKKKFSYRYAACCALANTVSALLTVIAAVINTDAVFDITPYEGVPGAFRCDGSSVWYILCMAVSALTLLFWLIVVLKNGKILGRHDMVVITLYCALPLVACLFSFVFEGIYLSYPVIALSLLIVYILLQGSHMEKMKMREELLEELSYCDALTHLPNRRAFDRDADEMDPEEDIGIVFCDLNNMKKVNDGEGHQAGDALLLRFTGVLSALFDQEYAYRISGDEFLAVEHGAAREAFGELVEKLRKTIDAENEISAMGSAWGKGSEIRRLVNEAEKEMYADKARYHEVHGPSR